MVTLMTQELLAVILEQKSYNTLKVPVYRAFKAKDRSLRQLRNRKRVSWRRYRRLRSFYFKLTYAISRSSRRRIFPTGVIGNDSRSTMCLGTLYAVKFSLQ